LKTSLFLSKNYDERKGAERETEKFLAAICNRAHREAQKDPVTNHQTFPEKKQIARVRLKSFARLFKGGGVEGQSPFLALRRGRNPPGSSKLRRGGQTIRRIVWPWGTLARGSPSSPRLRHFAKEFFI
jgi:hypothetical protein